MEVNSKQYYRTSKMCGAGGVDILTPGRGRLPAGEREGYTWQCRILQINIYSTYWQYLHMGLLSTVQLDTRCSDVVSGPICCPQAGELRLQETTSSCTSYCTALHCSYYLPCTCCTTLHPAPCTLHPSVGARAVSWSQQVRVIFSTPATLWEEERGWRDSNPVKCKSCFSEES